MKVPYEWLQTFFDTLPPIEEVEQKLIFHAYEVEGIEDDVLDVDVLPNRAADSLSVRGIAHEVSTLFDMPMKNDPLSEHVTLSPTTDTLAVSIDDDSSCSYYIAAHITGVTVKESPEWLRRRLEAVGQKSINNIVDATNYVLFELGRPTHVFDADKLDGIHVRRAREGEVITLLGGTEATLTSTMTVIADAKSDASLAVGGIKGGTHAEVDDTTTNVIIECANFDPTQTRVSAQALKMRTDASTRFENNMADVLADYGARRVVELILEIAGGQLEGFASAGEIVDHRREVSVSPERVNALLGASIATNDMRQILERIGCSVSGEFTVLPPQERRDIIIPEDVIEEIGRVYGYNNIVSKQLGTPERAVNINQKYARSEKVRRTLEALGYTEVYLYSLRDSGEVALLNSLASDKDHLRSNLTDGIVEALTKNEHNAPLLGLYDGIRLFEIGNVFTHEGETLHVGVGVRVAGKKKKEERTHEELSAVKEALEEALGVTLPAIEGETLEFNIEALDMPDIDAYEEGSTVGVFTYTPSSAYPFVLRDIAVLVPEGVEAAEVAECITSSAGELLVRVDLFDTFVKDGKTSYAYHLVFQSTEKTLTDAEVGEIMSGVEAALTTTHGWEIR